MKVKLEEAPTKRGGDHVSIATLAIVLEKLIPAIIDDEHKRRVLMLWHKYLKEIEREAISSNYEVREMKSVFNFPFETDYAAALKRKPLTEPIESV